MIMFMLICVAALIIWITCPSLDVDWRAPENIGIIVPVATFALTIELCVFFAGINEFKSSEDWAAPFAYQFFKLTNGRQLLKSEVSFSDNVGNRDLILSIKNSNNEVSHERILDFKTITKTDINHIVVNLDEGIMYLPYDKCLY